MNTDFAIGLIIGIMLTLFIEYLSMMIVFSGYTKESINSQKSMECNSTNSEKEE